MFFSTCSAGALSGPDFCFIFAPCGYDEPEILPSGSPSIGLTGADGGQFEAGFRGTKELNIGSLGWKIGAYRATNYDDILASPIPGMTGFGFFQNVGRTRRQGIEAEVSLKSNGLQFQASYAFLDARFLDALTLGSESP